MLKNRLILSAILIVAAAISFSAQTGAKTFRGYVEGESIQMTLTRDGGKLSGTYLYTRIGKDLKLAGTIDAGGNFKLKETDAAGKTTGEFSGKWIEEKNDNGVRLEGEWCKTNSRNILYFFAFEQMIEWTNGAKLVSKNFAESNKPKGFTIKIEYPELSGVNAETAANLNQLSKTLAMNSSAEFKKGMVEGTFDVGYSIEWGTDDIISLRFTISTHWLGAMHPMDHSETLNFNLKTGKEIKLADLFQPNTDYLKAISDYSIADLKTRLGDNLWEEGAESGAENYASWNLTKKGLMITFDPYQVASYGEGTQTVTISYSKLSGIMRKDFIPSN